MLTPDTQLGFIGAPVKKVPLGSIHIQAFKQANQENPPHFVVVFV